jgi:hypothetical protein
LKETRRQAELQEKAGLKGFKATGNPMRDAFRLMIEKKMRAMIQSKMAEENSSNTEFEQEVAKRLKKREQQWMVKIKTAEEARDSYDKMATETVPPVLLDTLKQKADLENVDEDKRNPEQAKQVVDSAFEIGMEAMR